MKINEITQQAIAQNRAAVENYLKGIVALQEQAEGFAEQAIEKAELIPEEGRKALQGLLRLGREYREEVATQVTRGREELEKLFPQVH